LYGKDTKQLDKTEKYIEKLKTIFSEIHVVGFDERFTSIEADSIKETF
jgi:RNase H-fold protein (predicted Holliday junction resolvase)